MKPAPLILVLLLAGCLDSPEAPAAGVHGDAVPVSGEVSVVRDGDQFRAARDVTLTNGYEGAIFADLRLSTVNGGITVGTCRCANYQLVASLAAWADDAPSARALLTTLSVDSTDKRSGQLLAIWFAVEATGNKWSDREASLTLLLPESLIASDSLLDTTNGDVQVQNLRTENLEAATTNGGVHASIRPAGDGNVELYSTNGGIVLDVQPPAEPMGFDVRGNVVNGAVTLSFPDTQPVGEQSERERRVRSQDFDSLSPQLTARLATVNGSIRGSA